MRLCPSQWLADDGIHLENVAIHHHLLNLRLNLEGYLGTQDAWCMTGLSGSLALRALWLRYRKARIETPSQLSISSPLYFVKYSSF